MTAHDDPALNGLTPDENVHGRMRDISAYAQFDWYEYVWYIDPPSDIGESRRHLGCWIGVAEDYGSEMTYYILPETCHPKVRSSVFLVLPSERTQPEVQTAMARLDKAIEDKIGDHWKDAEVMEDFPGMPQIPNDIFIEDDPMTEPLYVQSGVPEADEWTPEQFDEYLTAEVLIGHGDEQKRGVVKKRVRDDEGNPLGTRNKNPILDTREYEVQFADGTTDVLSANIIAEAMYSQCDEEE